jgi:hypothetical protein
MDSKIITDQEITVSALAEAIAAFDITKVADLLKDEGEYPIQAEKNEIVHTTKDDSSNGWKFALMSTYVSMKKLPG